ncbi:CocE/NonD family hydrolase [Streptococcus pneumoniae]
MNKKYIFTSLLIAPFLLATTTFADEEVSETAITETRIVDTNSTETSETSTTQSSEAKETTASAETTAPLPETATLATQQDLAAVTNTPITTENAAQTVTHQEAAETLLSWASTSPKQIGKEEADRLHFAHSLGLLQEDTDVSSPVNTDTLREMQTIAQKLHDAYRAEKKQPLFLNGKAQPIFPFSTGAKSKGYDYDKSHIVRHVVYVETDFDTDGDGKRDLVKALVQVPKAAVNGDFKASTIFEALPYVTGTTGAATLEDLGLQKSGTFNNNQLSSQPEKRIPIKHVNAEEAARNATSSQWYYQNPLEDNKWDYEDLNWYNYFLVRGFAVVSSAGLGSYDSEGFNTVGSELEVAAFKAILEWLDGKRVAYTDKTSNIAVTADWANGKVGMTGLSWGGTTNFALAATGIKNLKTIVPQAGIASWYEYLMSQGTPYNAEPNSNLSWLSTYVSGRVLDTEDWDSIKENYAAYITQLDKQQNTYDYNYSPVFKERDYTLQAENINIPALIVHGLNDDIVKTKNFELMYQAFKKAGQLAKLYLHQGNHIEPTALISTDKNGKNMRVFFDLLNSWFSHYLYDVENDVESLPAVTVQNNYDPTKWTSYDSWETKNHLSLTTDAPQDERATITSEYVNKAEIDWRYRDAAVSFHSSPANLTYITEVPETTTIKGSIPVKFSAALAKGSGTNLPINVLLVDISDEEFEVTGENVDYETYGYRYAWQDSYTTDPKGFWQGSNLKSKALKQYGTLKSNYKVIANGWVNLRNPKSDFDSASASESIDPQIGEFHDYTVYLQPTVYEVKQGHRLALVLNTYDTNSIYIPDEYQITFKTDSIKASIPTVQESRVAQATYSPSLGTEPHRFAVPSHTIPNFDKPTLILTHDVGSETLILEKPSLSIEEAIRLTQQLEQETHHVDVGEGLKTPEKPNFPLESYLESLKQTHHVNIGEDLKTPAKPIFPLESYLESLKQTHHVDVGEGLKIPAKPNFPLESYLESLKQTHHVDVGEGLKIPAKPNFPLESYLENLKQIPIATSVTKNHHITSLSQESVNHEQAPLMKIRSTQMKSVKSELPKTGTPTSFLHSLLGALGLILTFSFTKKHKK